MIPGVLSFTLASFVLGGVVLYESSRQVEPQTRRRWWIKYIGYLLIVHLVIGSAIAGVYYFMALMSAVVIIGARELLRALFCNTQPPACFAKIAAIFGVYLVLAYALVRFSHQSTTQEILFVYLVTATFDGFSQLTGQRIGRYTLAPRLSPNKTVEGALGGLAAAMLTGFALRSLANLSSLQAPLVGLVLGIAGLTGDLAASYIKRLTGVKDFGRILPEHGGILDRFDSLLVAAPTFFIFMWSH
jgi:phosphatidate cytidylyltransferase